MYAKALIIHEPPRVDVPLLVITLPSGAEGALATLRGLGWVSYGDISMPDGHVKMTPTEVEIVANGITVLLDPNGNPVSPAGWWDTVSATKDKCMVVVVESGFVDLSSPELVDQMLSLVDTDHAATALLPVRS